MQQPRAPHACAAADRKLCSPQYPEEDRKTEKQPTLIILLHVLIKAIPRGTKPYLSVKNDEERMIWSGLGSPLQHVLHVQELKGRNQVLLQPSWKKHAATSEKVGFSPQTGWSRGQWDAPLYEWGSGERRRTLDFTCLVVVLQLRHIASTGLCYPLACHQVAHYHRSRTNFCPPQPPSFTAQHNTHT